jgi:hypothetical protein
MFEVKLLSFVLKKGLWILEREIKPHSFVLNMGYLLGARMFNSNTTMKDTGGTDRTMNDAYLPSMRINIANDQTNGVVIGTGTTAPAKANYALETPTTADIVWYATSLTMSEPSAGIQRLSIRREIKYTGAGSLNIKEVGLYVRARDSGNFDRNFMVERTAVNLTRSTNQTFKLEYQFDLQIPTS